MGVSADTPTNLVVGTGEVYRNEDSLGASSGDNVYRIEREIYTPDLNGVKGHLLGTDYIKRSEGFLETTLPEVSEEALAAGWPGSRSTGTGTVMIDEDDTRLIPVADYADWELQTPRLGGGEFHFEIDDALQTGNLEGTFSDSGLFAPKLTLVGRWDPAALTASPHRIRILDVAS